MNFENSGLEEIVNKKIQIGFLYLLLCGAKTWILIKRNEGRIRSAEYYFLSKY
jgi:hypothetical protein